MVLWAAQAVSKGAFSGVLFGEVFGWGDHRSGGDSPLPFDEVVVGTCIRARLTRLIDFCFDVVQPAHQLAPEQS